MTIPPAPAAGPPDAPPAPRPVRWLGAPSPFGLALPDARPSPCTMYGPRGVWLGDDVLIVADTGNHRVLIWHGLPGHDHAPADVVLGQPAMDVEGPAAGGTDRVRGLHLPTGLLVVDGRLLVCDAWHHRVLVWDCVPDRSFAEPDLVLGQPAIDAVEPNGGRPDRPTASSFYWPFGLGMAGGRLWIADTGNRRVLGWRGVPEPGQPAEVVLGQPGPGARGENRDGRPAPDSFRWPHAVAGTDTVLYVADAGNHRVLGWSPHPDGDRPAGMVLGQPDFERSAEWPYGPQGASALRFPYALALDHDRSRLIVGDTSNNRVLVWDGLPVTGCGAPAAEVLGQPDMDANGENRWSAVGADTLCWPYGVHVHAGHLAVADSGNNRVVLWGLA